MLFFYIGNLFIYQFRLVLDFVFYFMMQRIYKLNRRKKKDVIIYIDREEICVNFG